MRLLEFMGFYQNLILSTREFYDSASGCFFCVDHSVYLVGPPTDPVGVED